MSSISDLSFNHRCSWREDIKNRYWDFLSFRISSRSEERQFFIRWPNKSEGFLASRVGTRTDQWRKCLGQDDHSFSDYILLQVELSFRASVLCSQWGAPSALMLNEKLLIVTTLFQEIRSAGPGWVYPDYDTLMVCSMSWEYFTSIKNRLVEWGR